MKIERSETYTMVKDIQIGECFSFQGNIYMRCETSCSRDLAVNLETGATSYFGNATVVTPMKLKVVPE